VSFGEDGLDASVVPMLLDRRTGPLGTLSGHVARANVQWKSLERAPATLAIIPGPDAYISPSWYPTKAQTGKVVATWNYTVVHVHGEAMVRHDVEWLASLVRRLTDRHEAHRSEPWSVDDAPTEFFETMLRGIVGIELQITRLEGKRKRSQNRPADWESVVSALSAGTAAERHIADDMLAERMADSEDERGGKRSADPRGFG
jgi:transcriptional regulator